MKYTAADAVIDAMAEARRSGSTVQHTLALENAALRADLKAVAVAAKNVKDWHMRHGPTNPQHLPSMWLHLHKALARPGVQEALKEKIQ